MAFAAIQPAITTTRMEIMSKTIVFSLILLLSASVATAEMEETIAFQGFEGTGSDDWSFVPDPEENDIGSDVWGTSTSVGFAPNAITASSGSNFWAMRDLEGPSLTLDFESIDTSGFEAVELSFDYNAFRYDSGDVLNYELIIDGESQGIATVFSGENNSFGGVSTDGWETETISIGTASSVSLRLSATQSGNGDWAGWDNISLVGTTAGIPEPMTAATFVIGLGLISRRRRAA